MSTSISISILLAIAVMLVALGYSFSRERTTQQQLQEQVAELQRQMNQLASSSSSSSSTSSDVIPHQETQDRQLQSSNCTCDIPSGFTYASDFGVIGDSHADDTAALQSAIDSASANDSGGIVVLPKGTFRIFEPLIVPAGVTLQGQGYGDSPLAISFDAGA